MYTDAVYIEIRKLPTKKWEFFSALEERHDGLFRASSNDPDGEPDYPLCGDMDYRIENTGGFYGNVSQKQVCRNQE